MMRLTRFLRPSQVKLELDTPSPDVPPEGWSRDRHVWSVKEAVLRELVGLLETSGRITNPSKLLVDLVNRERKASTAIGGGVAIPHVRSMQAREFTICIARSGVGIDFDPPDGQKIHLFFGVVAPPYDDRLYLEVYREIGTILSRPESREAMAAATSEHEIIRIVSDATGG